MRFQSRHLVAVTIASLFLSIFAFSQAPASQPALDVRVVTDEADAALMILNKKREGQPIQEADWQRLFSSEGYRRLKKREAEMKRAFTDEEFKAFILSDALAEKAKAIEETLNNWKRADATASARLALAYLPKGARIRAKIYPVIKPRENSFVFEVKTDPAIFLYIDPSKTKEQFENMLAHELHHIGFAAGCEPREKSVESSSLPSNLKTILDWMSAFGEGAAMLAAAGGPDAHPHATSSAEDRARWDRDVANFNQDLKKVEKFFLDILEKRLVKEDEVAQAGYSFFGVQGPWYTVGWKMAVVIEKTYGRARLIDSLCDRRMLLATYNGAAEKYNRQTGEHLALWSPQLIEALTKAEKK
ncbi:MAG TPA: DUF5700 domain-containing putative Zn-dependent protease [Blastocatellia bacterium]|nr:DUF5700 domain-containing putative Zn-dependent protease [Blastocatellia bacterium]